MCIENPATSLIWTAPPLAALVRHGTSAVSDYCQYGMPWRKRTRVQCWSCDPAIVPCRKCSGRGGLCSRTGKPHVILTGTHPTTHTSMTKHAEPYPNKWAKEWWSCIQSSIFNLHTSKYCRLGTGPQGTTTFLGGLSNAPSDRSEPPPLLVVPSAPYKHAIIHSRFMIHAAHDRPCDLLTIGEGMGWPPWRRVRF